MAACHAASDEPSTVAAAPSAVGASVHEDPATPVVSDLPCEIQRVFADHCWRCHGSSPRYGTRLSLATRADLLAPDTRWSAFDRVADRVVFRMANDPYPMPPRPDPRVPVEERQVVADWVARGLPPAEGACDAGASGN